jgi:hypothetical protein
MIINDLRIRITDATTGTLIRELTLDYRLQKQNTPNRKVQGVADVLRHHSVYAAAISKVDGRAPLLEPETLAEFTKLHPTGMDLVTGEHDHFPLGFEAGGVRYPFLGADAFGHCGAGKR